MMDHDQLFLLDILKKSLKSFRKKHTYLIKKEVHERTIASHIGCIIINNHLKKIQNEFQNLIDVDCEYNRNCENIDRATPTKELNGQDTFPDIIIHKRGSNFPTNLLIVEMKRNKPFDQSDDNKLRGFTNCEGRFRYKLGVYINILSNERFEITPYYNGLSHKDEVIML